MIARRLSFPGDSLVLLALLLAANLLRIYVPGPVTDGVFGMTVLFLALSLFREPFPASARTTVLCFAALLTVYAVGLLVEFSIQGASNLAGILFAGVIFLFCWRNAPTLIRAKYVIPLLLIAASALFPLYLLPTEFNPHGIAILLSYLLLTVGLIVIAPLRQPKESALVGARPVPAGCVDCHHLRIPIASACRAAGLSVVLERVFFPAKPIGCRTGGSNRGVADLLSYRVFGHALLQ